MGELLILFLLIGWLLVQLIRFWFKTTFKKDCNCKDEHFFEHLDEWREKYNKGK